MLLHLGRVTLQLPKGKLILRLLRVAEQDLCRRACATGRHLPVVHLPVSPVTSAELLAQVRELLIKISFPGQEVLLRFVHGVALVAQVSPLLALTCRVVHIVHQHLVAVAVVRCRLFGLLLLF